ncbi:MAG: type II secretion system protein J [Deltaproteobacteria bacterium]
MPRIISKTKNGFTFIELLVVTVMLAVISLAVFSAFSSGMKIMRRANRTLPQEDLDIMLDKFTSDVRNSLKFKDLRFIGTENSLELATLVGSSWMRTPTIGRVSYSYDPDSGVFNREQADFSQIYGRDLNRVAQSVGNIKSLRFFYYWYDPVKKEFLWQAEWSNEGLPLAVRLEFDFDDADQISKFTKTVSFPTSG